MLYKVFLLSIGSSYLTLWHLLATIVFDKLLELLYPVIFEFNVLLCLSVDAIVGIQFLLELDDCLVSFIETACKSNHDVSLLK